MRKWRNYLTALMIIFITIIVIGHSVSVGSSTRAQEVIREYFRGKTRIVIPSADFRSLVGHIGSEHATMLAVANYSKQLALHTTISHYHVGACVKSGSGNVYLGANCEFDIALTEGVHAEQCAVANAAIHGERSISKIAISSKPCGVCRQFLTELGPPTKLEVIFPRTSHGAGAVIQSLQSLLPHNFGPANLGVKGNMLDHAASHYILPPALDSSYARIALLMANHSYAPYTKRGSGVCLVFADGDITMGKTIENASFNAGLSGIRIALALAALEGKALTDIKTFYMAEPVVRNDTHDHIRRRVMSRDILQSICRECGISMVYIPIYHG